MSLLQAGFGSSGDDYEITDSLRLRSSASAYLSRTPSSTSDRTEWTWSGWVKKGPNAASLGLFSADHAGGSNAYLSLLINNSDEFQIFEYTGSAYTLRLATNAKFRDPSSWYHFVCAVDTDQGTDTNRIKLYVNGVQQTSLRLTTYPSSGHTTYVNVSGNLHAVGATVGATTSPDRYLDGYLTEVNFIDGQQLTADDFGEYDANGTWKAKEYTGTYGTNGFYLPMKPTTQAELQNTVLYAGDGDTQSINGVGFSPDLVWIKGRNDAQYHVLQNSVTGAGKTLFTNTTTAETGNGGDFISSFDSDGFTVNNRYAGGTNNTVNGSGKTYAAWTWDAGDNQPSTGHSSVLYSGSGLKRQVNGFGFGPDLVWIKNRLAGNFHYLYDSVRGAHNSLSTNSTGVEDGYAYQLESFDSDGFTVGNDTAGYNNYPGRDYIAWGWDAGDGDPVTNTTGSINSTVKASDATGFSIVSVSGQNNTSTLTVGHGLSTTPDMIIGKSRNGTGSWAVWHKDLSSASHTLFLNSTSGEAVDGGSPAAAFSAVSSSTITIQNYNRMFGNGVNGIIYAFSEVSGVSKFSTYTGNGSATGPTITTGFRPGFVMTKRTDSSGNWYINDGTRSPSNPTVPLYADLANAEAGNGIDLLSNGFQIKNADSSQNASGGTYIYMAFKGSYSDHVSPLNDDGSIDSRVKANTSKGFSIVSYEGTGANATVGHGLSAAPEMIIVKNRTGVYHWIIQHASLGATKYLTLSTTDAEATSSAPWNDTAPTSSVFSLGTSSLTNRNANDFIAYCFHSVAGYSKFGTYTGNGSTTGPTITTGFRSGFVMVKSSTSSGTDWLILDGTRSPNNTRNKVLFPNLANAEAGTGYGDMDVTDTGFQIKTNGASSNANGQTYIYMAFAETADAQFNFDASGNKNNFDANNINSNGESETTYDLMKDTPSLVDENAGNFAVINPLVGPSADTISEANLKIATSLSYAAFSHTRATIGVSSGKWYWEVKYDATSATSASAIVGITTDVLNPYSQCIGQGAANVSYGYRDDAYKFSGGSISSYGASYTVGDVIGVALDLDAGTLAFYKNGVAQGTAYSSISGTYFPGISDVNNDSGRNSTFIANFGQRPFAYTPPTGFLKLNTFNLPDSTIEDGSDYFAPVLYTGTGSSRSISVGFQPDWTWWKSRNVGGNPALFDSVRGVGKYLVSNATNAEATVGTSLTSFDSDGYTIGTNTAWNSTGNTFVSWNWKANGTGVSNTAGTITSTVSANPTAGFSVVSWSGNSTNGATIGHGLGTAPNIIFTKCRSHATSWIFGIGGISGFGVNDYFNFQTTGAKSSSSTFYQAYSTNTFQVGVSSADEMNKTGRTYVSYCFAEVLGYSAIGSYTGSGSSTDGPFIYTGFTPRWILAKVASSQINATSWQIYDTARNPNNVIPTYLFGDSNSAESDSASTYFNADILSNGFKLRAANTYGINQSGATYIYMAFAENPFKNSNAR